MSRPGQPVALTSTQATLLRHIDNGNIVCYPPDERSGPAGETVLVLGGAPTRTGRQVDAEVQELARLGLVELHRPTWSLRLTVAGQAALFAWRGLCAGVSAPAGEAPGACGLERPCPVHEPDEVERQRRIWASPSTRPSDYETWGDH